MVSGIQICISTGRLFTAKSPEFMVSAQPGSDSPRQRQDLRRRVQSCGRILAKVGCHASQLAMSPSL